MKKIVNILFATAVAALAMISCQKKELAVNANENEAVESQIHFYATEVATKTVFGDLSAGQYPTLWTDTKGIKISYNKKASVEATVTPKDGDTKADFAPDSGFSDDGTGAHVFYAMSPSSAQVSKINTTYCSWKFDIPSSQTPLTNSVDEGAQLLYAKYDAGSTFPTSVPFAFNHLTAYGKLTFSGLALDGDEDISSITLTASEKWVGQYYYYVADHVSDHEGDFKETSGSKKLTLTTNKSSDIWFACAPVNLSGGGTIDISVFTNKGVFVKKVTFPAAKGNFQAGHVASFAVDMSAVTRTPKASNIAAIKALYSDANVSFVADLTDALVTTVSGNTFFMEDATGGIKGNFSGHGLEVGDKINGIITGTVTKSNNNYQLSSLDKSDATITKGIPVTPTTVPAATLASNFALYESKLVKVAGVEVSEVNSKNLSLNGIDGFIVYNNSNLSLPVGSRFNAVGPATYYNSTQEIAIYTVEEGDRISIVPTITCSNTTVAKSSTVTISPTINSTGAVSFSSLNTDKATVNSSTGEVTGVDTGDATIRISVAADGYWKAGTKDITVTVTASGSKTYTVTFAKGTTFTSNVTGYTSSFVNTCDGLALTLNNINNGGNNNWTEMRAGRSGVESTPTIVTNAAVSEAIKTVTITITQVDTAPITSAKLYVSSSSTFATKDEYNFNITGVGDVSATVTSPAANKYYKIEIVTSNAGTANGFLRFNKLVYSTE